jgi:hypothetical protein
MFRESRFRPPQMSALFSYSPPQVVLGEFLGVFRPKNLQKQIRQTSDAQHPCPAFTVRNLTPALTGLTYWYHKPIVPHSLIYSSSSTVTHSRHVPGINRSRSFVTLPSNFPSRLEVLPKADQDRPSQTSACLPVAILRLYHRHPYRPSRSSSRIRQISQW